MLYVLYSQGALYCIGLTTKSPFTPSPRVYERMLVFPCGIIIVFAIWSPINDKPLIIFLFETLLVTGTQL